MNHVPILKAHKTVTNCTYWTLLGSFNNCDIIQLSQKSTPYDPFEEIDQVVIDGISDNMDLLVESGKYGAINISDTKTNVFCVIIFRSEAYKLQDIATIDGTIISDGELVVKTKYLCSMQVDTNWYWNQHPQKLSITVPTRTILHPQLEVNAVTYFHAITTGVCTWKQAKKYISRQPICLTGSDYDYIL